MKKQQVLGVGTIACLIGGIIPATSFAGPKSFGIRPPTFERTRPEKSQTFEKNPEKMSLERLQRSQEEKLILSSLGINRDEMKNLIHEFKSDTTEYQAFQNLLATARRTSSSKEDRALLKNYFQLISKTSGEFHLSPTRLESQIKTWSPFAKLQFAKVLETATEMSGTGKSVLREDAFEQALKKYDLDRDYRKQCRK